MLLYFFNSTNRSSSPQTSRVHVPNTSTQAQRSSPVIVPVSEDSEYSFSGARGALKNLKAVMSDASDLFIPNETPQKPPAAGGEYGAHAHEVRSDSPEKNADTSLNSTSIMSRVKAHEVHTDSDPIVSSPTKTSQVTAKPKLKQKSHLDKYMLKQSFTAKEMKEANKVTKTKDELLSEMVLQISEQLHTQFDQQHLEHVFVTTEVQEVSEDLPIISWKRKVKAMYDKERDVFVPCLPCQIDEKCVVLYYKAAQAIEHMQNGEFHSTIEQIRRDYDECHIIVMLEGYQQHLTKIKNLENTQYKRKVLSLQGDDQIKRRKTLETIKISSKEVEKLLDKTQYELNVITFPVRTNQEAIEWLHSFTYTIAFALYDKLERNAKYSNLGSIKSGADNKGTFIQSMNQFKLMSVPRSERLFNHYKSIHAVYQKFTNDGSLGSDGNGKSIVPPSTENAMKRFFMSDDPNEIIHD